MTIAVEDRDVLCRDDAGRLAATRAVARSGRGVLLFCVADDHVHLVVDGPPGRIAGAVAQALAARLGARLEPARAREVAGRAHLQTLVRYVHDQSTHHGLQAVHPARWVGSSFADVVGARILEGFDPGLVRGRLPRWPERRFWEVLGLEPLAPLAGAGLPDLVRAGAAAVGRTGLGSKSPLVMRARRAVVALAEGYTGVQVAAALETSTRTVRSLREGADPAMVRAVRLQLALAAAFR